MSNLPEKKRELNSICPYFTMFPLDFPLSILRKRARRRDHVLDPFCGRGTTNFAARLSGLHSLGVDSSPVAAAITAAKLIKIDPIDVVLEAANILENSRTTIVPQGEFWELAYHPTVLLEICKLRSALLRNCETPERIALRGLVLGALHGPKQVTFQSYFSNQCPRTYAPKPAYAVSYWRRHRLYPELVNVIEIIARRAGRYYSSTPSSKGSVRIADSRVGTALTPENPRQRFNWIITSPPYYGMRTYIPDQWLRNWFVGGPDHVDYSNEGQLEHSGAEAFSENLKRVWINAAGVSADNARLVIRFGGIPDRSADPRQIVKSSLDGSGWKILTLQDAGTAMLGKRQAASFLKKESKPLVEYDVWAAIH